MIPINQYVIDVDDFLFYLQYAFHQFRWRERRKEANQIKYQ